MYQDQPGAGIHSDGSPNRGLSHAWPVPSPSPIHPPAPASGQAVLNEPANAPSRQRAFFPIFIAHHSPLMQKPPNSDIKTPWLAKHGLSSRHFLARFQRKNAGCCPGISGWVLWDIFRFYYCIAPGVGFYGSGKLPVCTSALTSRASFNPALLFSVEPTR